MKFISLIKITSVLVGLFFFFSANASPQDSVGIVKKNGTYFIKHKIDKGNTLYSLAKRYNVSVSEISDANPETPVLKQDLFLFIPTSHKIHIVKAGETLYSISKLYVVNVEAIKKINKLSSNELSLGQELILSETGNEIKSNKLTQTVGNTNTSAHQHTVQAGETLYSIARKYKITVSELQKTNNLQSVALSLGDVLKIPSPVKSTIVKNYELLKSSSNDLNSSFSEIISPRGNKGDIVRLKSSSSGEEIYARIVKLSFDDKIYASERAYKLLKINTFSEKISITLTE